jgi:hypothetical protein
MAARPAVDFSKLSLGSLRRYEAMYGIQTNGDNLVDCVRDHFGSRCYGLLNEDKPPYKLTTNFTMDFEFVRTELMAPEDIIDKYLKIKKDDKAEETGLRKSTRNKEKTTTFY